MANRFQKAVENRSSEILNTGKPQEAEKKVESKKVVKEVVETPEIAAPKVEEKVVEENSAPDLSFLKSVNEKAGKNKTFYLDNSVLEGVKKIAKEKKMSESKLVNDILKHVLKV